MVRAPGTHECPSPVPVEDRLARRIGVPLQPAACERAQRHQGQSLAHRPVDGRGHQPPADAVAFHLDRDLGVDQYQPVPADTVDKLREPPVRAQLEPGLIRVVGNLGGITHRLRHHSPPHRPYGTTVTGHFPGRTRRAARRWRTYPIIVPVSPSELSSSARTRRWSAGDQWSGSSALWAPSPCTRVTSRRATTSGSVPATWP